MFENVQSGAISLKRRAASLSVTTAIHAAMVGSAIIIGAAMPAKEAEPVAVQFVRSLAPPPPPPARKKSKKTVTRQMDPNAFIQPKDTPTELSAPEDEDVGVEGGVEGGVIGGVIGGVVGGTGAAPVEFDARMTPPKLLSGPSFSYTQKALEKEVEGLMMVKCIVTADGRVHSCRVLQGLPFMDRAVVDALEQRRYTPALLEGKPIDVDFTFKIRLKLPPAAGG
jgi:protein TonB